VCSAVQAGRCVPCYDASLYILAWGLPYHYPIVLLKKKSPNLFVILNLETIVGDLTDVEPIQAEMQMLVQMALMHGLVLTTAKISGTSFLTSLSRITHFPNQVTLFLDFVQTTVCM